MPTHPAELTELAAGLNRLARNLWWSWDQQAQEVFHDLSPRGWQNLYHNAVAILREVSPYELRVRLQEPGFADRVRSVLHRFDAYLSDTATWGALNAPALAANPVLKIGFVGVTSGPAASWGISNQRSMETRADWINETGGVKIGGTTY
ncbi:MAG: DUF3417 domain-containing protein, partial [Proteobacteria bacterium]|nr:DUF3417 domain-containing protein [Pseudomonadota bacterium]